MRPLWSRIILCCMVVFITLHAPTVYATPLSPDVRNLHHNWQATVQVNTLLNGRMGHGTGTVVSHDGYILTAAHVAVKKAKFTVELHDAKGNKKTVPAKLIGRDRANDLAILKINSSVGIVVTIGDTKELRVAAKVYNVGYPFSMGITYSEGHVMQVHLGIPPGGKDGILSDHILMDIANGPGSSGSAIFSKKTGRLLGVMRLIQGHGTRDGMILLVKWATPVNKVHRILKKYRVKYRTPHGYMKYPPKSRR